MQQKTLRNNSFRIFLKASEWLKFEEDKRFPKHFVTGQLEVKWPECGCDILG